MDNSLEEIRIYLDESRHLKTNNGPMLLGGIWGTFDNCKTFNNRIKSIKHQHNIPINQELKWTKVGNGKFDYYADILRAFIEAPGINYRGIIIDKSLVNGEKYGKTDDDFYYKVQYQIIRSIALRKKAQYRLFFDYKDTWSSYRANETVKFLKNTERLKDDSFTAQPLRSDEVSLLQIADFITGLVAYANSSVQNSETKKSLVTLLEQETQTTLRCTSPSFNEKINLLIWTPKEYLDD